MLAPIASNFTRHQPCEVKQLMRDAASPGIPWRIHSWKVTPCPRVLLRKITELLAMVGTLYDVSSTLERHEDGTEECRHARRLIKSV